MSSRLLVLVLVIVGFGALTAVALLEAGYVGLFTAQLESWAGLQVLTDLGLLAILACIWMLNDSRKRGLPAWPFVIVTVLAGSFGPLLYLVMRELRSTAGTAGESRRATA